MRTSKKSGKLLNRMKLSFPSLSVNEGFARAAVAAFCAQMNPTATDIADIKCAISEAVTNCIVHAYKDEVGEVYITAELYENSLVRLTVKDKGCGIPDIEVARRPLFTTDAEGERSGMGFTVMESFTDKMMVRSKVGKGTTVTMQKKMGLLL